MTTDSQAGEYAAAPHDKAELMARIDREWAALEHALAPLDEAQMTAPGPGGWSVKDLLAHISAWERVLLVCDLQGGSFAEAAGMDQATSAATEHMTAETGLNDYFYQRDKQLPLTAVLSNFRESHRQVVAALEQLGDADLQRAHDPDDPEVHLMDSIIGDTYAHYHQHRATIEAMFEQRD
jgi:uncharacterized protein (TIGR03083 family)